MAPIFNSFSDDSKIVILQISQQNLFSGKMTSKPSDFGLKKWLFDPPKNSRKWAKLMKNAFFGRVRKTVFSRWQKKLFFSLTKSRCLGEKKGVQFAWAKRPLNPHVWDKKEQIRVR